MTLVGDVTAGAVHLTSGTLPSWVTTGAQCNGGTLPHGTTITSITDSTHFATSASGVTASGVTLYVAQLWAAAEAKMKANLSGGLSVAAGFFGADGANCIDLRPAGVPTLLWLMADTYWATAAGQARTSNAFLHNCVALQTVVGANPDLSADTLNFVSGGTAQNPTAVFPGAPPDHYGWPQGGICLDSTHLFVTFQQINVVTGVVPRGIVRWISNPTAAPSAWLWQTIPSPFTEGGIYGSHQWFDPGDGYVYVMGYGASAFSPGTGQDRNLYLSRFVKTDLTATPPTLANPQWWTALGWLSVSPDGNPADLRRVLAPIMLSNNAQLLFPDGNGSFVTKANTHILRIGCDVFGNGPIYASDTALITDLQTLGPPLWWPPQNSDQNQWCYGAHWHPEQTWSGQGADEFCATYSINKLRNVQNVTGSIANRGDNFGTVFTLSSGTLASWVKAGDSVGPVYFGNTPLIGPGITILSIQSSTTFTMSNLGIAGSYTNVPLAQTTEADPAQDPNSYWPQVIRVKT